MTMAVKAVTPELIAASFPDVFMSERGIIMVQRVHARQMNDAGPGSGDAASRIE